MALESVCEIVTLEAQPAALISATIPMSEIPATERALVPKIRAAVEAMGIGPAGKGFTRWRMAGEGMMQLQPGLFTPRAFEPAGEVECVTLPAGRAAHFKLVGGYEGMGPAWGKLFAWISAEGLTSAGFNWQVYEPWTEDSSKLVTDLYVPLAD